MPLISGSDQADGLVGSSGDDTIWGYAGNDTISGLAGNDRIITGDGVDVVDGGVGNDEINGYITNAAIGAYSFYASTGAKTIDGGEGNDFVYGGTEADRINGGVGNDQLYGADGADVISGGDGADTLNGQAGDDTLDGGDGNDSLTGGTGSDSLVGGAGDDVLYDQESGSDTLQGGVGNDKLSVYTGTGNKYLDGGDGNDTLYGGTGSDTLIGGAGNDSLLDQGTGADSMIGGAGNDSLDSYSGTGNKYLDGGDGNDTLYGGTGNDTLTGGSGIDDLEGGAGNDVYYVSDITDYIYDSNGTDTAYVSQSFVKLPSSIENVFYTNGALALPYWINALLSDSSAGLNDATLLGSDKTFKYIFPSQLPTYYANTQQADGSFVAFSNIQIARTLSAFEYIKGVIDVQFVSTTSTDAINTLSFATNTQTGSAAYAFGPSSGFKGNDVFINKNDSYNTSLADNTYGSLVLIHEIGHALGLKHPFFAANNEPPYLTGTDDSSTWTVMSYTSNEAQYHLQYSPMDIAALQYIYGPSTTARTGADTYSISETSSNFIWDGAGTDKINAASSSKAVTIYLEPGYWGYVGNAKADTISSAGQITVNFGSQIENLDGSTLGDSLYGNSLSNLINGNAGNDTITGGGGNDTLDGGGGQDTVVYALSASSYTITAITGGYQVVAKSGTEGTDTLFSMERLAFADQTVSVDTIAPTVSTFSPADEATAVTIGANIVVTFSEAIQRGAGDIVLKTAAGATVATYGQSSSNVTISGSTLTINPTADLNYSTGYKVEFAAGSVQDTFGNSYAGTTAYNFTTGVSASVSCNVSEYLIVAGQNHLRPTEKVNNLFYGGSTNPSNSAGKYSSATLSNGVVTVSGDANYGGDASTVSGFISGGVKYLAVIAEGGYVAIKEDGSLKSWGPYGGGKSESNISQVAVNMSGWVGLKNNGSIVSYGGYSSSVPSDTNFIKVFAGGYGLYAGLTSDGKLKTWGYLSNSDSPSDFQPTSTLTDIVDVSFSYGSGIALKKDGTTVTWGHPGLRNELTEWNFGHTFNEDTSSVFKLATNLPLSQSYVYTVISNPLHVKASALAVDTGLFTYQPIDNYNGSDTLTYQVTNAEGQTSTNTVKLSITSVNDAPVASAASITTNEDTAKTGTLTATDVDSTSLTFAKVASPTNGTVTINTNGTYTYTPNANFNGTDSFTFKANDGAADSAAATVSITVTAVNDAPVATAVSISTNEDTVKNGTLTATDVDSTSLTFSKVASPSNGTVTVYTNGTYTYTPNANFNGTDSFTFKANDGSTDSAAATVAITVVAINDTPVAAAASITTNEDTAKTGTLTATDIESTSLTYVKVASPTNGTVTVNSNGSYSYTPNANFNGTDSFTFKANDGSADSAAATVSITVSAVNDSPVGTIDIIGTAKQGEKLTATRSFTDADGLPALGDLFKVTWLADGAPFTGTISGTALSDTGKFITSILEVTADLVGKKISFSTTYTDNGGTQETVTSAQTVAVVALKAGVTWSNASSLSTNESGTTATYGAVLDKAPTKDVTLTLTISDATEGVFVSTGTTTRDLVFTPSNWNQVQNIQVKGVDDSEYDKDVAYTISTKVTSSDLDYDGMRSGQGLATANVTVNNVDDDIPINWIGTDANDVYTGGPGADDLYGNNGRDDISGGKGNDRIYGGYGDDVLSGDEGNDEIEGEQGNDKITGGTGDDNLKGGTGADTLYGGDGSDILNGGEDADSMDGGNGADTYYVDNPGDVVEDTGTDNSIDILYIASYLSAPVLLGRGVENATLNDSAGKGSITGNESNNTLNGNASDNSLSGGSGNDTLESGAGNDSVDAGTGDDLIVGGEGAGNDTYVGGTGTDTVKYTSAVNTILVNLLTGLAEGKDIGTDQLSEIENLIGGQTGDTLIGDNNANNINAYTGNDTITGHGGNDTIDGGVGQDTVVYALNASNYTVTAITGGYQVVAKSGNEGTDTLLNIESLQFANKTVVAADFVAAGGEKDPAVAKFWKDNTKAPTDTKKADAVNLTDAIAILKMIVGLNVNNNNTPLSPYQAIAADFDQSGDVGLTDAIGVLKMVVGLSAPTPTWKYYDDTKLASAYTSAQSLNPKGWTTSAAISDTGTADSSVKLIGVLTGDVDGSWTGT